MKQVFFLFAIIFCSCQTVAQSGFECGTSTVTDIDGNVYHTVHIGLRCWLKENMRTTRYPNGQPVGIRQENPGFRQLINVPGNLQATVHLSQEEPVSTAIYDMDGKLLYHAILQGFAGNNLLDLSAGPAGLYLVTIDCRGIRSAMKVTGNDLNCMGARLGQAASDLKSVPAPAELWPRRYYDYDNDPSNDEKFGKLYTPASALDTTYRYSTELPKMIQGICPDGWHVSNDTDWRQLEVTSGIDSALVYNGPMFQFIGYTADKLKTPDTDYWESDYGTDDFGFSARGGGWCLTAKEEFNALRVFGSWLNYSNRYGITVRKISAWDWGIYRGHADDDEAQSIRCVKNY